MIDLQPILDSLDALRGESTLRHIDITDRLARVETHMETLMGNGKPGKIQEFTERIDSLESSRDKQVGAKAMLVATVAVFCQLLQFLWKRGT